MPFARLASCFAIVRYAGLMRSPCARCSSDSASARAAVASHEMHLAELRPGAELSRPQQRDEVVQLAQVVLQWRRREQQDEVAFDFLNELVGRAALALDLVRLVHDHEVPAVPQDLL